MDILKIYSVVTVEVNQVLFGTRTYVNGLDKCVKFYIKIPTHSEKSAKSARGYFFDSTAIQRVSKNARPNFLLCVCQIQTDLIKIGMRVLE